MEVYTVFGMVPNSQTCSFGSGCLLPANAPQPPLYQRLSSVWERDSLDWKDLSADEIYKRVTSRVRGGSIILFHNAAKHTPEALGGIIEYLLKEGYEIVPVSEMLLTGEYDIDNTGRMTPKA